MLTIYLKRSVRGLEQAQGMLSRMKVSAAAVSVQRKFGQMPNSDQYLKPQLAGRVQMNDGTQQWMPISKQSTLFFSDKNDKDEGNKAPKGFEKFFKKKEARDAEKSSSSDSDKKKDEKSEESQAEDKPKEEEDSKKSDDKSSKSSDLSMME